MKKTPYIDIFIIMLSLLFPVVAGGQDLPLMPSDPAVSSGVLPNGMSYYIVENPTSKGLADFALVQKTGTETVPAEDSPRVTASAKDALASLPRLKGDSPQAFLARRGVTPGKDGFVKVSESATVFYFDNVVISAQETAVDSTLLVLLDISDMASRCADTTITRWYAPADQAVVVSGDVKAAVIIEKLRLLSLMTPAGESQQRKTYVWQDSEEPVFESSPHSRRNLATVSATWASPRTPQEYMNTVQPAIYEMFVSELGILAQERLKLRLRGEGVPVADISYSHLDSVRSLGDESFTVSVSVAPEYAYKAVEALAAVMSSLDAGQVALHEVEMARRRYVAMVTARSEELLRSNSDYVDRCASAFLYNAPLSSDKEILAFLRSRDLDASTELQLFNNIASALLDGNRNLTVECRLGGDMEMDSSQLKDIFSSAWNTMASVQECKAPVDSLPLPVAGEKAKVRSVRPEHMSGGVVWIFENGFKVAYKRRAAGGKIHYSLALNGGYGNIRSLSKGEGAYMSDYMRLCRVSGMSGEDFRNALEAEGMTMDMDVNLSNMIISGALPDGKVDLLMGALLAVAGRMEPDSSAFEYYRSSIDAVCEYSRGNVYDRMVAIDSLMCPDYIYSDRKTPGSITEGFRQKADAFIAGQMQKMNDGLLVLVGDIEETRMRKMLQSYVGGFNTVDQAFPRTVVRYQTVSGACTYTLDGMQNSMDVAMSVRMPLTADNYMASFLAAEVLKQEICEAMNGTGVYVRLSHNCRIYPHERFNVMVTIEEASPDGFATGAELTGFDEAVSRLRATLDRISSVEISETTLAGYGNVLKGHMALEMSEPTYWTHAIAMRYLDGKDLTTGYDAKIDAVTVEKVRSLLASLTDASKVEYITRK